MVIVRTFGPFFCFLSFSWEKTKPERMQSDKRAADIFEKWLKDIDFRLDQIACVGQFQYYNEKIAKAKFLMPQG
jgi:hypothetical protein